MADAPIFAVEKRSLPCDPAITNITYVTRDNNAAVHAFYLSIAHMTIPKDEDRSLFRIRESLKEYQQVLQIES